jgi:hypothetical protein
MLRVRYYPPLKRFYRWRLLCIDSHRGNDTYFLSTHLFHCPVRPAEPNKLAQLDNVQVS